MDDKLNGLSFFFKHRKLLLAAVLMGGLLGIGFTFFVPKKYMSTAIVYPYNSHTLGDIVSNPQFGYEVETEQLLQLLESKSMRDRTIREFELYDYYELDTNSLTWESDIALKYITDVDFFRSKYLSVVINVTTKEPELSAKIANFQVTEVNNYREAIFEQNRLAEFDEIESEFVEVEKRMNTLKDSIYSIKGDKAELLYNFIEKLDNENFEPDSFVDDPNLEPVIEKYIYELGKYRNLRESYRNVKQKLSEDLPSVYSIDEATPSYKKVSPSFSMNAIIGACLLFGLTLTLRLVVDKWKILKAENTSK